MVGLVDLSATFFESYSQLDEMTSKESQVVCVWEMGMTKNLCLLFPAQPFSSWWGQTDEKTSNKDLEESTMNFGVIQAIIILH